MDMREWRYAISEIDGYVQVKGNQLVEASLHSFPDSPREPISEEAFTKQEVRDKFAAWRASLLSKDLTIPDGLHLLAGCTTAPRIDYKVSKSHERAQNENL
ncbi:uncharacterized protein LOC112349619 isoform X2 [Selaginella moellendorffii]|uniref:uncharacterized protein LOC112349619 isoform X2 n=1 Tax=Selaginella moellendorffii TaxID=88036 RepID=UPI000D1C4656|nr:uncharacterized protein LOC112349619 isoform X2 [Selaginella moellendorffii]|eukprot:XP_024540121.1 uncharacterized protein LOC112349619 isoform X2 [Selaginella moellendorffii]